MKRYKKQKDLIRVAIKNIGSSDDTLTAEELYVKYILILGGMRHPSDELIRKAMENVNKVNEIVDIVEGVDDVDKSNDN